MPDPSTHASGPGERAGAEFLKALAALVLGKKVAVVSHANADLDGVASAVVLCELLKALGAASCCVDSSEGLNKQASEVMARLGVQLPECPSIDADVLAVVDASNAVQLGQLASRLQGVASVVLIDHHSEGTLGSAAALKYVKPEAPSCAELVVDLAISAGVNLGRQQATLAIAAILDETSMLMRATPTTLRSVASLAELGGDYELAYSVVQRRAQEDPLDVRMARLKGASRAEVAKTCDDVVIAVSEVGSYEAEVAKSLISLGADVALVVKDNRISVRLSKRAMDRGLDASGLASYLAGRLGGEGGGHKGAAALTITGKADVQVKRVLGLAVNFVRSVCEGANVERAQEAQDLR